MNSKVIEKSTVQDGISVGSIGVGGVESVGGIDVDVVAAASIVVGVGVGGVEIVLDVEEREREGRGWGRGGDGVKIHVVDRVLKMVESAAIA